MAQDNKRVGVNVPGRFYRALKQYCGRFDVTMSDLFSEAVKIYIEKHFKTCKVVQQIYEIEMIALDARGSKPCYGHLCRVCSHRGECVDGLYSGTFVHDQERYGTWDHCSEFPMPVFEQDFREREILRLAKEAEDVADVVDGVKRREVESILDCFRQQHRIAFVELDFDSNTFSFASPAWLSVFGLDPSVGTLPTPWELSPPTQPCGTSSREKALAHIAEAQEKGSVQFEWMHRTADGLREIPGIVTLSAIKGHIYGIFIPH